MQNTTLDPELYLAAKTGNKESFITHAHLSVEEQAAFNGNADPKVAVVINVNNDVDQADPAASDVEANGVPLQQLVSRLSGVTSTRDTDGTNDVYRPAEPAALHVDENDVPLQQASSHLSGVTSTGDTVLHIATLFQQTELAKKIYRVRPSLLTEENNKKETPLHYAARAGNQELVQHFIGLACGDSNVGKAQLLHKQNQYGETALYLAVLHQHQNVVEKLMKYAPVDQASVLNNQNTSPLYLAITLNAFDIVTSLLQQLPPGGSKWPYLGPDGQTALHAAALRNKSFAELILNWNPELTKDADKLSRTPLHYAASLNNPEVVKMLLEKEEPITSAYKADSSGLYPVHVAAKLGHLEVLMEILNQCPDSEELLDRKGRNFLHLAIEEKRAHVVQFICKQMKFDRALNSVDNHGNTPLHLAVQARSLTMLSSLISSKSVQLNWLNEDRSTALDIAYDQEINNFFLWQNLDSAMYRTLYRIGCVHGPNWPYHLIEEKNGQDNEDREKKDKERNKNIAERISTIAVLIAAATFAALFAVSDVFINNKDSYNTFDLADDFYGFVVFDAGAFVFSTLAALLVEGTLNFLNNTDEKVFLRICANCVMIAAKSFIMAFATGACVILTPLNEDLARHVEFWASVGGIVIIVLLQWEGILLTMAIIWYKGVKALFGVVPHAPTKVSAKLPKFIRILYFISETLLLDYVMSVVIVVYLVDLIMEFRIPTFSDSTYETIFQVVSTTLLLVITSVMYASKATTRIVGPFS